MREMRALWSFLLLSVIVQATTGQAPGDEDERCLKDVLNEEDLMRSSNYRNLTSSMGGPWTVVNDDSNNQRFRYSLTSLVTTVSPARSAVTKILALWILCSYLLF